MYIKLIGVNTRNRIGSALVRNYWGDLVNTAFNLQIPLATDLFNSSTFIGNELTRTLQLVNISIFYPIYI